jgi:DNA-binding IclR family transcriptional regulator
MASTPRVSGSATKVLRVIKALKGHSLHGLSNGDLAKGLGESPSTINRALNTLIEEGFAVRLDTGRFAPGISLLQIAQSYSNEMSSAQQRINETNQRVLAGAHTPGVGNHG